MHIASSTSLKEYGFWRITFAGFCAILIGLGLCRFAFTPLIPAMINHGWLTKASAGYLGAINFVGYLVGAFLGMHSSRYVSLPKLMNFSLILSVISLAGCTIYLGFTWFAIWRFLAGVAGALLMILTPGTILKQVPLHYAGRASGLIFAGLGLGVIVTGFVFPYFANIHVAFGWLGATLFALLMSCFAWPVFAYLAHLEKKNTAQNPEVSNTTLSLESKKTLSLLTAAYICYAVGIVPHSLFLVDYIHRELGLSTLVSGLYWSLFGLGALLAPFITGMIADNIGIFKTLVGAYLLCIVTIALVLFNHIALFYALSAFLMGMMLPSIVTLVASRIKELVSTSLHARYWGKMTFYFAISQSAATYFMSFLLYHKVSYMTCFAIADVSFMVGTVFVLFTGKKNGGHPYRR